MNKPVLDYLFGLSGQVAIVTGSTKGIGLAAARALARAGARVVISSRSQADCDRVADELAADGFEAIGSECDVSDSDALAGLVARTEQQWGRIDILVCNAAVSLHRGPNLDIDDASFDATMTANVRSIMWLCKQAMPIMARQGGAVVLMSSIAGLRGNTMLGTYGVSKAAEMALARNLALEWGPSGIRVNAIAPGLIKTDFAKALWQDPENERAKAAVNPLRRLGRVEDVAGVVVMLASAAGAYINGQVIVVDGGTMIAGPH
ncbi:short-chain dehydrogenase [Sandarakinorhabdus cyanobacteriorum]|uniref:Short-chain dehydrogenase n=1 Tax=Sandarakinorhabdus cyanobacteriorum TaxID=1981098 RepID=A0A255Z2R5_9SPHN|nr:glucose 1-dehydrogenase [Sandarakinorhabdus cyanobacteriorum]OYQ35768.1 short-chain dehydrogenase [Sandarakinorhabdus cyanobacteriorum]